MKNELYNEINRRAARFNDRDLAFIHAATAIKPLRVMLGDDRKFWVVRPVDADRLERMGYEYAN